MHIGKEHVKRTGTQAVYRACRILSTLSLHAQRGIGLLALARAVVLDAATTRRLLLELIQNGFVTQDPATKRYFIGIELFSIAAVAADRFDLADERRNTLTSLSRAAHGNAAFLMRERDTLICVDAVRPHGAGGGLPIGARWPIGPDAYGMALIATLPTGDGESIIIRNGRMTRANPEAFVREAGERLRQTRRDGYGVSFATASGICSIAAAITDPEGNASGIIGVDVQIDGATQTSVDLGRLVLHHARLLQHQLWRLPSAERISPVAKMPENSAQPFTV